MRSFIFVVFWLAISGLVESDNGATVTGEEYFLPCVNDPLGVRPEETFPTNVTLRAAVLTNTVPLAYYDESTTEEVPFAAYRGFQPDLLRALIRVAQEFDNITLTWELEQAPPFSYGKHFEMMSNDCNSTTNRKGGYPMEQCLQYDMIIGDYYGWPMRSVRTLLTPPFLTTAAATLQFTQRQKRPITTLEEAQVLKDPVCLLYESHFDLKTLERFPDLLVQRCSTHEECVQALKADECSLFVEDQLYTAFVL